MTPGELELAVEAHDHTQRDLLFNLAAQSCMIARTVWASFQGETVTPYDLLGWDPPAMVLARREAEDAARWEALIATLQPAPGRKQ